MTPSPDERPVIVGVDGSAYAELALRWAADQAAATGSSVEVVAAWDWPKSYGWVVPLPSDFDPGSEAGKLVVAGEDVVRAAHPGVRCTGTVVQGAAPMVLVDASRRGRLLVVGSRGHGELAGMFIGSVSQYCVAHAHCPVVVVRGDESAGEGKHALRDAGDARDAGYTGPATSGGSHAASDGGHAALQDQAGEGAGPR